MNDPTSAVQALDQLDDALQRLARRSLGDGRLHAGAGRVLVRFPAPTWDAFMALAVDEIIVYGAGSIQVTRRLRAVLDDLLTSAPPAGARPSAPVSPRSSGRSAVRFPMKWWRPRRWSRTIRASAHREARTRHGGPAKAEEARCGVEITRPE